MKNLIIGIFGMKGSGKTLFMVLLLYLEMLAGKKIMANIKLYFDFEPLDPDELAELSKRLVGKTIGIDELHQYADSRRSGHQQNINIGSFFLQSRHRGVNVIYTEQFQGQAEKRCRDNTDIKVIARNLYIDSDGDGWDDIFEYTIIDLRHESVKTIIIYGKPLFDMYNSEEIVDKYHMDKPEKPKKQRPKDEEETL